MVSKMADTKIGDPNQMKQLQRDPNAMMKKIQQSIDPRMLAQVGGASGVMKMMEDMGGIEGMQKMMGSGGFPGMGGMGGGKKRR